MCDNQERMHAPSFDARNQNPVGFDKLGASSPCQSAGMSATRSQKQFWTDLLGCARSSCCTGPEEGADLRLVLDGAAGLFEDGGDGVGEGDDVGRVNTCHGDSAVLEHVDMMFCSKLEYQRPGDAGEGKHTNLVGDVVPGAVGAERFQVASK